MRSGSTERPTRRARFSRTPGNKVGELFAIYNGVAAIAALTLLPWLSRRIGKSRTHIVCLLCGAAAFASFFVVRDRAWLTLSEVGIGIAWASILAMPYAILASALPQRKLGIYMGLFNVFVVLPQLLVATVMGTIMKALFPDQPIWTMLAAALVMAAAALAMLRVAAISKAKPPIGVSNADRSAAPQMQTPGSLPIRAPCVTIARQPPWI